MSTSVLSKVWRNSHWLLTVGLTLALFPLQHFFGGIPISFEVLKNWWVPTICWSTIFAAALYTLTSPQEAVHLLRKRQRKQPFPWRILISVTATTGYFLFGFLLVLYYNPLIARARFTGIADGLIERLDERVLLGFSVPTLARWWLASFPSTFTSVEVIYFSVFMLTGACLVTVSVREGAGRGLQFAGALLSAYYISLFIFFLIPTTGPYFSAPIAWPDSAIRSLQTGIARELHSRDFQPSYYIGFPSMHVTQVLIAVWFFRFQKSLRTFMGVYAIALTASILILEEHYVLDILAAFPVAVVAVTMATGRTRGPIAEATDLRRNATIASPLGPFFELDCHKRTRRSKCGVSQW